MKNNDFKFNYDSNKLFSEELCNTYQKYNWKGYNVSNSGISIYSNKNAFYYKIDHDRKLLLPWIKLNFDFKNSFLVIRDI